MIKKGIIIYVKFDLITVAKQLQRKILLFIILRVKRLTFHTNEFVWN